MPTASVFGDVPGGSSLLEWFGRTPSFHDAELLEISFFGKGEGRLRLHAWNLTNEVDAKGYFVLDKHAIVTLAFEGINEIHCTDFDMIPGIIFSLEITKTVEHWRVEWGASYGVAGFVIATHLQFDLQPGKPD